MKYVKNNIIKVNFKAKKRTISSFELADIDLQNTITSLKTKYTLSNAEIAAILVHKAKILSEQSDNTTQIKIILKKQLS